MSVEVPEEPGDVVVGVAVVDGATLVGVGDTPVGETDVFAGGVTDVVVVAGEVGFGVTAVVELGSVDVTGPGVPVLSVVEHPSKKVPTKNPYRDVCMMKSKAAVHLAQVRGGSRCCRLVRGARAISECSLRREPCGTGRNRCDLLAQRCARRGGKLSFVPREGYRGSK